MNKPKILSLNIQTSTALAIKDKGYNLYEGSLGKLIDTKNKNGQSKLCLLNLDYPDNIHEYDLLIFDLEHTETIDYVESENRRESNRTENNTYLLCRYPQIIFDPRAMSSYLLIDEVSELLRKESMIIVFQSKLEGVKYNFTQLTSGVPRVNDTEERSVYDAIPEVPFSSNKSGKETVVVSTGDELSSLLEKYNADFSYQNVFNHPLEWKEGKQEKVNYFIPLVTNRIGEIVSYAMRIQEALVFVFPNLKDTASFIVEFLEVVGPSIIPSIFPDSTLNSWTNQPDYYLPNHKVLQEEKEFLKKEWEEKTRLKEKEIADNKDKYQFLHDILTETGDSLVTSTIKFLEWLGFDNVKDMDEEEEGVKKEDIQIETEKGLIVVEVKGIGGTSKDSECSQILKNKYRRAEERGSFDVFGLYIVNHRRHLPPLQRENPPFTPEQLTDAKNEKRGLLTTFQLYNLFFDVSNGVITKEEARERFFDFGLVEFRPSNLKFIDKVDETFLNGTVSIVTLDKVLLKSGMEIYIERDGKFDKTKIIEIKLDDKPVEEIDTGEVGIKTDKAIKKKSKLWVKDVE